MECSGSAGKVPATQRLVRVTCVGIIYDMTQAVCSVTHVWVMHTKCVMLQVSSVAGGV